MPNYEINENTLAIIPQSKNKSIIYEDKFTFTLNKSVDEIMENSCQYYGSSMDGRRKGTTSLTGLTYKVPVIVSEEKNVIFFPTSSPRLRSCGWISHNNVAKYFTQNDKTYVEFFNKQIVELDMSTNILRNQILNSSLLESSIRKRSNNS